MKVGFLNSTDYQGGAARAAYRIHRAVLAGGIDSTFWVDLKRTGDVTVNGSASGARKRIRESIGQQLVNWFGPGGSERLSPAIVHSRLPHRLNGTDTDVLHLHWVNDEMLSIADIARFRQPILWTLHDMWAFCGAEHYSEDDRWRNGYTSGSGSFDLNRWVWGRKRRHWKHPLHIVTPSHWLAGLVAESELMKHWPVSVIHNAIDTDSWRPTDQRIARETLGLPSDEPLVVYGADQGTRDPRKGFDLLEDALRQLRGSGLHLHIAVIGQEATDRGRQDQPEVIHLGRLQDDLSLKLVYAAADVVVIPSRQDNLPNAGVESMACGTPVVAFSTGGLPDIVDHKETGYLARAFDATDLATGLEWVLDSTRSDGKGQGLSKAARKTAEQRFSYETIGAQYIQLYRSLID